MPQGQSMVFPRALTQVPSGQTGSLGLRRNPTSHGGVEGLLQKPALPPCRKFSSFLPLFQQGMEPVLCINMKDTKFGFNNWLFGGLELRSIVCTCGSSCWLLHFQVSRINRQVHLFSGKMACRSFAGACSAAVGKFSGVFSSCLSGSLSP